MMRVNVAPELAERCPNILANNWARKQPVTGRNQVINLMEQYDYCRIRLDSVLELIDKMNRLADKTNREQGLSDEKQTAAATPPAQQSTTR